MTKSTWHERLAKTVSKFVPKSNLAQFRNEYREIVRSIVEHDKTTVRDVLLEVEPVIETWVTEEDKCPCCALREWSAFYERAGLVPVEVRIAIAKKLPQSKSSSSVDWQPFFFRCKQKSVLTALFDRRLVTKGQLQAWICEKLRDSYSLPVLDLAIENDAVSDYRSLWANSLKAGNRPSGLLSQEEVLAYCYAREPLGSLDKELNTFLVDKADSRGPFFRVILRYPGVILRITEVLASLPGDSSIVDEFVKICGDEIDRINPEVSRASLALTSLRLFMTAKANIQDKSVPATSAISAASKQLASHALTRVEEDTSSQFGSCYTLLSATELHDIVHSHLQSLSRSSANSSGPTERSSQYERHVGKKEVLDKVLRVLSEGTESDSLRECLEVELFNLGVRPLGKIGETVKFDSRLHKAGSQKIVPGDNVEITDPGRRLGKDADTVVLSKATVKEKN